MRLVYIAGALSAPEYEQRVRNIARAEDAGHLVAVAGAMPVIPHTITRYIASAQPEAFWYEGSAELLRRCDAVYVFDTTHVETSRGTRAEVDLANSLYKPVFIDLESLRKWLALDAQRDREIREMVVGMGLPAEMAPKSRFER
jgi:nucleoside 2-deoxyribosyltransferase